jgi:uncharacterized protein YbjT (DUF2867 family)
MAALVVGATGATGKHLVEQLLNFEQKVKVIVRSPEKLPQIMENQRPTGHYPSKHIRYYRR